MRDLTEVLGEGLRDGELVSVLGELAQGQGVLHGVARGESLQAAQRSRAQAISVRRMSIVMRAV